MKKETYYIIIIFIISIIQAYLTPITSDEAYYWMYGQELDWGYFDHPPLVALSTFIGDLLLNGTLGVRIITILFSFFSYFFIWKLIPIAYREKKNALLYFLIIILAIPLCNLYSFITTPDAALLCFAALYLYIFQQFIKDTNFKNALLLGITAALLMYAKYHGGLIIILAILPHLRLFKSIHFYIATVIGLALYLPHIIWQIEHDFISFKFHLFDRADSVFKIKNVVNYILASILVLNPLLLFLLFWKKTKHLAFKNLPKHYAYLFFGGLLFFFLSSFRDKIEPHWVFFTVIPLILFSFQVIIHLEDKISLIKKGLFFFIILIFGFRIIAILPLNTNLEFHKEGASYFETVQNKAKDLPVAYVNSYQKAAKHTFYTGNTAFSSNNYFYRKNQYDLWNYEDSIHNKEILLVGNYPHDFFDSIFVENEDPILVSKVAKFPMINKLHSEIKSIKPIKGNEYEITFSITNPYTYTVNFQDAEMPLDFKIAFNKNGERESSSPITVTIDKIAPKQTLNLKGRFSPAITLDDHLYSLNIRRGHLYYVRISDFQKMDLE